MKHTRLVILMMFLALFSLKVVNSQAPVQLDPVRTQISDLEPYFSSYFEPFARGMAVGMGGGWYNTAKVHSFLGFDISLVSISLTQIPDADKTFSLSNDAFPAGKGYSLTANSDLPTLNADEGGTVPTLRRTIEQSGSVDVNGNPVDYNFSETEDLMEMPEGAGLAYSGALNMVQVGFGLPKGITIKARFLPEFEVAPLDLTANLWGVGLQHDILQWIPVASKVPFLQASIVGGYSKFTGSYGGPPFAIDEGSFPGFTSNEPASAWGDQSFELETSSLSGGLVVGASLPVVHPYVGLNYNKSSFTGGLRGNFPIAEVTAEIDPNDPNNPTFEKEVMAGDIDPLDIETDDTMIGFTGGLRVKLAVITLWGQYTVQEYPMINAGLGISFR